MNSDVLFPMSTIEHTIELLIIDYLNINKIERFCPKCAKTCEIVLLRVESGPFWSKKWSKRPKNRNWPRDSNDTIIPYSFQCSAWFFSKETKVFMIIVNYKHKWSTIGSIVPEMSCVVESLKQEYQTHYLWTYKTRNP